MQLIDKQAALKKMCGDCKSGYDGHCPHPLGMCHEYESIYEAPTIEPEVRHGRWIVKILDIGGGDKMRMLECTECSRYANMKFDLCPNCGARMDGGADNAIT